MNIVWTGWLIFIVISFAVFEGLAIKYHRSTLSRFIWTISKAWPPFGWVAGLLTGFLAAHFWWIGQACDLVNK